VEPIHAPPTPAANAHAGGRKRAAALHPLLALQGLVGNAAVNSLVQRVGVQRLAEDHDSAAMGASGQVWLRRGSTSAGVIQVQERLNEIGTAGTPLEVTGRFDGATERVVRQFQVDHGIDDDGVVGPLTWEALDRLTTTTAETVVTGEDLFANTKRIGPASDTDDTDTDDAEPEDTVDVGELQEDLNPTSSGDEEWDGLADDAKKQELKDELIVELQAHLDEVTPRMRDMEAAKAAGNVLSTQEREGAGIAAKRYADAQFGDVASAAVLTRSQETARAAFRFEAGVNLLDASDPAVRPPDPADLAQWISDTDSDATDVQTNHHFNRRREGQGEPEFFEEIRTEFIGTGTNEADLRRYDLFGFFFTQAGPRVLSQVAILPTADFSGDVPAHGGPSEAERAARWATWEILVHEYFHTLAHPAFSRAAAGNRILTEGFCELFTKAVLDGAGAVNTAKDDADASLRIDVEGGDWPGFDPAFVPEYDPGSYADYLAQAESITAAVGVEAARAAFFLGHVELIGVNPDGSMVDPSGPDAAQEVGPGTVDIPDNITSVTGVSIMTGASEADIVAANTSLTAGAPLPASAHTDGLTVPGTSFHRVVAASDRRGSAAETKELIARQHGITEAVLVRANPHLNHREPREGEWVLIPVH
jgi:peptidoglycan hydrolase-like protein with peptidoglycan-binding domain